MLVRALTGSTSAVVVAQRDGTLSRSAASAMGLWTESIRGYIKPINNKFIHLDSQSSASTMIKLSHTTDVFRDFAVEMGFASSAATAPFRIGTYSFTGGTR